MLRAQGPVPGGRKTKLALARDQTKSCKVREHSFSAQPHVLHVLNCRILTTLELFGVVGSLPTVTKFSRLSQDGRFLHSDTFLRYRHDQILPDLPDVFQNYWKIRTNNFVPCFPFFQLSKERAFLFIYQGTGKRHTDKYTKSHKNTHPTHKNIHKLIQQYTYKHIQTNTLKHTNKHNNTNTYKRTNKHT